MNIIKKSFWNFDTFPINDSSSDSTYYSDEFESDHDTINSDESLLNIKVDDEMCDICGLMYHNIFHNFKCSKCNYFMDVCYICTSYGCGIFCEQCIGDFDVIISYPNYKVTGKSRIIKRIINNIDNNFDNFEIVGNNNNDFIRYMKKYMFN